MYVEENVHPGRQRYMCAVLWQCELRACLCLREQPGCGGVRTVERGNQALCRVAAPAAPVDDRRDYDIDEENDMER